jgi:uncharacterized oligopeptide transporter (OPT) family protein
VSPEPDEIPAEVVAGMDEEEWYARAYRAGARQLTVRAVVTGSILGFFLAFTNVYIGLKTGFFLGVNLTASIVVFAIWSMIFSVGITKKPFSILEANCAVSTTSSAGFSTGNAIVTSIPALLLLSVTEAAPNGVQLRWYVLVPWIFFLALLGVSLAIPMKRAMINRDKLRFPSGTATAVTLQGLYARGAEGLGKARALFISLVVSAFVPLLRELEVRKGGATIVPAQSNAFDWIPSVLPESWTHRWLHADHKDLHPSDFMIKLDHGLALVWSGMLVGLRITSWMVVSGLVLAIVITPIAMEHKAPNAAGIMVGAAKAGSAWREIGVWIGAPMLVASGLVAFATRWRTVVRAFESLAPSREASHADVEVPGKWFVGGVAIASVGIVAIAWVAFEIPPHLGLLAVLMSFVVALVASRTTGESDITASGPLGKIVQLAYGVLMPQSTTANLMTASISANAANASADLLSDLKSGYLLGASPRRQFLAQAMGIVTGSIATVLCWYVLVPDASVLIGTDEKPPPFPVPGAQQWRAVADVLKNGLASLHPMSQGAIKWGIGIGIVLALAEALVPKDWKKWVPSPTGIGFGLLLPFFFPLAMFTGAAIGAIATAIDKRWAERYLVAIAAGGMAGESIVGVVVQAINNFVIHR